MPCRTADKHRRSAATVLCRTHHCSSQATRCSRRPSPWHFGVPGTSPCSAVHTYPGSAAHIMMTIASAHPRTRTDASALRRHAAPSIAPAAAVLPCSRHRSLQCGAHLVVQCGASHWPVLSRAVMPARAWTCAFLARELLARERLRSAAPTCLDRRASSEWFHAMFRTVRRAPRNNLHD